MPTDHDVRSIPLFSKLAPPVAGRLAAAVGEGGRAIAFAHKVLREGAR